MDHTEHMTRRREVFPIRESDATLHEEQRRHWGGYGGPSGLSAHGNIPAGGGGGGGSYGGATATGGGAGTFYGHVSGGGGGGGSYGGATGSGYATGHFGGGGGGGGGGAAAAAAAAAAHAAAVAQAVSRNNSALGLLGFHSGGQTDPVLSQIGSLLGGRSAVSKALGGKVDTGLKASASIPAAPKVQMPKPPQIAAVHAVAMPHPSNPFTSIGSVVGQHAAPIVYAASLSPAKQHLLAQVDTQNAAHNALAQAGLTARNQSVSAYNTQAAAHNAQGQAVANQLTQNNLRVGQSLIHPGADTNQGFWGHLNMRRFQMGTNAPQRSPLWNDEQGGAGVSRSLYNPQAASASPISAITNLFGGSSKPNFKAIGAAAGQAAKPAPIAKVAAAQASTHTSALKSLNTAAGKAVTKNAGVNALGGIVASNANTIPSLAPLANLAGGGHLGSDRARIAAHQGGGKAAYTPQQIARGDQSSGYALAIAKKLGANPMQQQALLIAATANPKTLGNTVLRPQHTRQAFQNQLHAISDFVSKAKQTHTSDPVHLAQQVSGFGATNRYQANAQYLAKSMPARLAQAQRLAPNVHGLNQALSQTQQGAPGLSSDLKSLFVAAGKKYGIDPAVLFGIASNETGDKNKGTVFKNPSTSSAGAVGWMQFMPGTWAKYGVKAPGGRGAPDPHNVADAVYSAANYLRASGYKQGNPQAVHNAIFSYNHANWYVNDVLNTSRLWRGGAAVAGQSVPGSGAAGAPGMPGSSGALATSGSVGSSAGSSGAGSAAGSASSKAAKQAQQDLLNRRGASLALATQLLSGKSGALSRVNGKKGSKTPTLQSLLALR